MFQSLGPGLPRVPTPQGVCVMGCPGGGLSEAAFPGPPSHLGVVWLLGSAMWGTGWGPTVALFSALGLGAGGGPSRVRPCPGLSQVGCLPPASSLPVLLPCPPSLVLGSRTFPALEWGRR